MRITGQLRFQNLAEVLSARFENRVSVMDTFEDAICSKY